MPFRDATTADIPAIVELVNRAYRVEDAFIDGDRTDAADVAAHLQRGCFVLAEDASGLTGAVFVELRPPRGYFGMLAVHPRAQRNGLGAALVREAESRAIAAGCDHMELSVIHLRSPLLDWYARLGYRVSGTAPFPVPTKLKQPAHFVLFTKALAAREPAAIREEIR
ncbi:MAG: GNAT family N-acetyltransferase [Dehalococcoidia bacterium]